MIGMEEFTKRLRLAMQSHSTLLKGGELFLPEYLQGKVFVNCFGTVVKSLAENLNMDLKTEYSNKFPKGYEFNRPQRVDYAFFTKQGTPWLFLELESLNRSQMYLFTDGPVRGDNEDNKLWYYNGTLAKSYDPQEMTPEYFVFLLILPDRSVRPYEVYDVRNDHQIHDPSVLEIIYRSPFKFYSRQIRAAARGFLRFSNYVRRDNDWKEVSPQEAAKRCELVIITCTIDRLVLSRGRDLFDEAKEMILPLQWGGRS